MSILSRFFGRRDEKESQSLAELVANPNQENSLSLQVVFSGSLSIDESKLEQTLRGFDSSMKQARCQRDPELGDFFALVGWGKHVVRMVGFNAPFPAEHLEKCVGPSHYGAEMKEQVRANESHVLLWYAGYDDNVLEQYIALALVAGALERFGALAVLNESAYTSLPAGVLGEMAAAKDGADILRYGLPLTMLFCGFVKYEVEGVDGVWMRTYGANGFGLPDFAVLASGHEEGQKYSDIFSNILRYLLDSGAEMVAGHTMEVAQGQVMKLREPAESEYFLDGPGTVLVAEIIDALKIAQ
ncbi:hypothetical protein SOASR030_02660 [Leminorella grimontii]|uniref:DUF4261 domain-containing protein n=1 Tax=Leminorella grimontii TaxID=82981 RepID=A0AAV5MZ09_9GAMM|nr:DUF4261 domain-containing protein [Leminorella grimontii]GKX54154.1 hypothetical protein SOASR030_02660 [Leminorella grimontii]VFS59914.1 Uncharacterised protein [Leminorella grimontii]